MILYYLCAAVIKCAFSDKKAAPAIFYLQVLLSESVQNSIDDYFLNISCSIMYSAICRAFKAAPFLIWSPHTQRLRALAME